MKKSVLIVAALGALVLAGCAYLPRQLTLPPPNQPQVSVVDDRVVVVSPEPLAFRVGDGEIKIVWQLPKISNYRFPANGIVVEGQLIERAIDDAAKQRAQASRTTVIKRFDLISQDEIVCPQQDGGSVFTCINKRSKTGYFKYTIRVVDRDKKELKQDPGVWNY